MHWRILEQANAAGSRELSQDTLDGSCIMRIIVAILFCEWLAWLDGTRGRSRSVPPSQCW